MDTITGVAFINDQGQIDAIMNIDSEGILLSECWYDCKLWLVLKPDKRTSHSLLFARILRITTL